MLYKFFNEDKIIKSQHKGLIVSLVQLNLTLDDSLIQFDFEGNNYYNIWIILIHIELTKYVFCASTPECITRARANIVSKLLKKICPTRKF